MYSSSILNLVAKPEIIPSNFASTSASLCASLERRTLASSTSVLSFDHSARAGWAGGQTRSLSMNCWAVCSSSSVVCSDATLYRIMRRSAACLAASASHCVLATSSLAATAKLTPSSRPSISATSGAGCSAGKLPSEICTDACPRLTPIVTSDGAPDDKGITPHTRAAPFSSKANLWAVRRHSGTVRNSSFSIASSSRPRSCSEV